MPLDDFSRGFKHSGEEEQKKQKTTYPPPPSHPPGIGVVMRQVTLTETVPDVHFNQPSIC